LIIIQTAYPCVNCKEEISPLDAYCSKCGTQQPGLAGKTAYNIFYRPSMDRRFNTLYGGTPILEKADIQELAEDRGFGGAEYFVGGFEIQSEGEINPNEFPITIWIPVKNGQLGEDQGPQTIQLTSLE
jgi:hypothetical protein